MDEMKMMPSGMLACLVSIMLCAGCSVKENRDMCPCRLVLDFSEVDTSVVRYADLIMTADDGFVFTDELEPEDLRSGKTVTVPRGEVNVSVWNGTDSMMDANGISIPYGEDCPPVYFHVSSVDADCELVRDTVMMRKNHCRLTINLKYMETDPKEIVLIGNVDGYGPDGTPSVGDFLCRLPQGGAGHVVLPRQLDNSLAMEMNDGSGVLKRFALGEYIAESGYDWSAPDLEDLTVDIDIAFTGITLVIQGWDRTYRFDMVI